MKRLIIMAGAVAVACMPAIGSAAPLKHHKAHHGYASRSVRSAYGAYGAYGMTVVPDDPMPDYGVTGPAYYDFCQDPNVVTVARCPASSNGP